MKTEKIYLVVSPSGQYDDYRTLNHKAFKNPLDAEKEKQFWWYARVFFTTKRRDFFL